MKTWSSGFLLVILLFCASRSLLHAQDGADPAPPGATGQEVQFEHLTTADGLPANRIFSVIQDSLGFIWMGTAEGLARFDGYSFKLYTHNPEDPGSLSENVIRTLYEDREGMLWIGTFGGGLDRFDRNTETFTHYLHDPEDPDSLGGTSVRAIIQDSHGSFWIGTDGGGLDRLDHEYASAANSGRFIHYQHDPTDSRSLSNNNVWALTEDKGGVVWVGTGDGLNSFDPQTETFTRYKHDPNDAHSLSANEVEATYIDQAGILWVGTVGGGLNRLDQITGDGQTARFTHYWYDPDDARSLSHNWVTVIQGDRNGALWVGTRAGGLNRLDSDGDEGQTARFTRFQHEAIDSRSLGHNEIRAIHEDDAGILWFGTFGGGVSQIDPQKQRFGYYRHDPADPYTLSNDDVHAIYEDRAGALWVGSDGGGLDRLDPVTGRFTHHRHDPEDPHSLSDNHVVSIYEDTVGAMWLGTISGGLNRFDRDTGRFTQYRHDPTDPQSLSHDHVRAIHEDRKGTLWIGTFGGGLNKFDRETEQFTRYQHDPGNLRSLSHDFVASIHEDRSGVLWVTTRAGGLNKFDAETELFTRYQHDPSDPESLSDNTVATVHEDQAGVLWIGTFRGLDRFDRTTGQFSHYTSHDGLPTDVLLGILEEDALDGGGPVLWLSSGNGLSRFDTHAEAFKNYGLSDGLQGDGFNFGAAHKSWSGELFFGGLNGLNAFDPASIRDNPYVPPVVITDFQLANKPVAIGGDSALQKSILETKDLALAHDERVISFEFAALNFSSPERNRFRYRLDGFDEEWTEVSSDRRFVTYTNLDPGDYVFRVLGSNNDGVWNEEGSAISITITPPWWQTIWFRGGLVLLFLGLVTGGFVGQRASSRRRERQLEAQVAERTQELGERVKELDCLYGISSLAAREGISLNEVLQGTVALLPTAWQYPEIARARLVVDGQQYVSEGWQDSEWRQSADIMVHGERAGEVEVRYLEARPDTEEGSFMSEERLLLKAVAERVGRITERIKTEAALRKALSELSTILTVSGEIARTLDLDPLLELILSEVERVITYDGAGIFTLSEKTLDFRYHRGIELEVNLLSLRIPFLAVTAFRELALDGKPFIYDDLHDDPVLATQLLEATGLSLKALFGDCRSWLCVPLIAEDRVIGLLAFIHLQPGYYQVETQELAQAFANQAAIALENARLYRQSQKLAVLEERTRIAGELHDSVTQALYTSSLIAETLPNVWQSHPEEALRTLDDLRDLTQGALAEMRALLLELRPGALASRNLSELLHQLTAAMSSRTDLPITTTVSGEDTLPEDVRIALYRIAQEALNNVSKHARASRAWVNLRGAPNEASLRIRDNGRGFDPEAVLPHHMGLSIMRERAGAIGATLTVDSQPGQGTEVVVTWAVEGGLAAGGQPNDDDKRQAKYDGQRTGGGADE